MGYLWLLLGALWLTACSQNTMSNHYACSYETTNEAYQTCMDVANGVDQDTMSAAGKKVKTTP
jgi:predicted small secreted protein